MARDANINVRPGSVPDVPKVDVPVPEPGSGTTPYTPSGKPTVPQPEERPKALGRPGQVFTNTEAAPYEEQASKQPERRQAQAKEDPKPKAPARPKALGRPGQVFNNTDEAAATATPEPEAPAPQAPQPAEAPADTAPVLGRGGYSSSAPKQPKQEQPDAADPLAHLAARSPQPQAQAAPAPQAPKEPDMPTPPRQKGAPSQAPMEAPIPENAIENDPLTLVDPRPRRVGKPSTMTNVAKDRMFTDAKARSKMATRRAGKREGRGNSVFGTMVSDGAIELSEISFGTKLLVGSLRHPESMLRPLVAKYRPEADIDRMVVDDAYAASELVAMFAERDIRLLITKHPVPDEMSSHVRTVRVHSGEDARLHPLAAKMFNADNDGDQIAVSFDENEIVGTKSAMDYLIGTDNEAKIDEDFFAMRVWGSDSYVRECMRQLFDYYGLDDISIEGLAKSVIRCSYGEKGSYRSLIRWVRDSADRTAREKFNADPQELPLLRDMLTEQMMNAIYRYNKDIWKFSTDLQLDEDRTPFKAPAQSGYRPGSEEWDADLSEATMPANLIDLLVSERNPISPVARKNVHWRAAAAAGKRIKPTSSITVGNRRWKKPAGDKEWLNDADEIVAKKMSSSVSLHENRYSAASYLRGRIVKEVGFPSSEKYGGDFKVFAQAFAKSYNLYQTVVAQSNVIIRTDGSIERVDSAMRPIKRVRDNKDIRAAFKMVYGEYTMATLFGKGLREVYGLDDMPLNDFIDNYKGPKLNANTMISDFGQMIRTLQDMHYSASKRFNQKFEETLDEFFDKGKNKIAKALKESRKRDYNAEIDALTEALYLLGPDAFYYFNMTTAKAFRNVDIGRRMIAAKNPDILGGVVYEAIARYRLAPAYDAAKAGDAQKFNEVLDSIASISDTWKALIADYRKGGTAINDILLNENIGKTLKDDRLNKLVKDTRGLTNMQLPYEIAKELMGNPRGMYAGPRTTFDESGGLLDNFKAASSKIKAAASDQHEAHLNQVAAMLEYRTDKEIEQWLKGIASGAVLPYKIQKSGLVDSIGSTFEKTFDSTEKSTQEFAPAGMYFMTSVMKNGGVWSDLAVADDFFLGKIALDRFVKTPMLMAQILVDPSMSIEVYDPTGSMIVSRETLCGDNSTSSLKRFLTNNPRIAMSLRGHSAAMYQDEVYTVAEWSLEESVHRADSPYIRVLNALSDHPGFSAMVALMVPAKGRTAKQMRQEHDRAIDDLILNIMRTASLGPEAGLAVEDLVRQRWDDRWEGPAQDVADHLIANLQMYVDIVRDMHLPPVEGAPRFDFNFGDEASLYAYFDVAQVLSGAKTQMSTGVNGAESQRNGAVAFYASYVPEACDATETLTIPVEQFIEEWEKYERRKTVSGERIDETTYQRIALAAENGTVEIEIPEACNHPSGCPCKRHVMLDPSTNLDPDTQSTPLGRYMTDKRTAGSESMNLKVKTLGDDGMDSIAKFHVLEDLKEGKHLEVHARVHAAFDAGGLPAARRELAKQMQQRNRTLFSEDLGYDFMNEDDFVNIAQSLLKVNEATGELQIFSIGQLSQISKQAILDLTAKVKKPNELEIQTTVVDRIENFVPADTVDDIGSLMKVCRQNQAGVRFTDEYRSSEARNAQLVEQLYLNLPIEPEDRLTAAEVASAAKAYEQHWFQKMQDLDEKSPTVEFYIAAHKMDLLGVIDDEGINVSFMPGPATAWAIAPGATKENIIEAVRLAKRSGADLVFDISGDIIDALAAAGVIEDCVEDASGAWHLPFFDIQLNGGSTTGEQGAYNVGVYRISGPEEVVRFIEDPINLYSLSDSDMQAFSNFTDRVKANRTGMYELPVSNAFKNLREEVGPDAPMSVSFPLKTEVQAYIVNDMPMMADGILIDIGQAVDERTSKATDEAIARYVERWDETDDWGWLPTARPEEIVGWIKATAGDLCAWHPVRMYDVLQDKSYPVEEFTIEGYAYDALVNDVARGRLLVKWSYSSGLEGHTAKMFEHWFSANKLVIRPESIQEPVVLENGVALDIAVAAPSTQGRRLTYLQQQLMCTLIAEARLMGDGYNFADVDGSFPGEDAVKAALSAGEMRIGDWVDRLAEGPISFFPEGYPDKPVMDAYMKSVVESAIKAGVNPSDVLASSYNGVHTYHWFRFNVIMGATPGFRDFMMKWFNLMIPNICPNGVDGDPDGCLFDNDLKVLAPLKDEDGQVHPVWANMFTGLHYFDTHFGGYAYPGRNATAHRSTVVDNTLLFGRRKLGVKVDDYLKWIMMDTPTDLGIPDPTQMSSISVGPAELDGSIDEED